MSDASSKITAGKPDWDEYFLRIADAVSLRSSCSRRKVGAVVVGPDRRILATGYNDAPAGLPGCEGCPRSSPENSSSVASNAPYDAGGSGSCGAIHAEQNVMLDLPRSATQDAIIYITEEPCPWCRKLLDACHFGMIRTPTTATFYDVAVTVNDSGEPERPQGDVAADIFAGGDE